MVPDICTLTLRSWYLPPRLWRCMDLYDMTNVLEEQMINSENRDSAFQRNVGNNLRDHKGVKISYPY